MVAVREEMPAVCAAVAAVTEEMMEVCADVAAVREENTQVYAAEVAVSRRGSVDTSCYHQRPHATGEVA